MFGDQRSKEMEGPNREAYGLSILEKLAGIWASFSRDWDVYAV
jgi:hypothetical protein